MSDFILSSKKCKSCMLEIREGVPDDGSGICPTCRYAFSFTPETKAALWKKQLDLFLNFDPDPNSPFDALVLWSGGSDSTLALYEAKYTLGLKVAALKFECFFERTGTQAAAADFLDKHDIPVITIKVDIREMFVQCHKDEGQVSEKLLADFPWDSFHASGDRSFVWKGAEIIARKLGVKRVICGNNLIDFGLYKPKQAPSSMGEQFIRDHVDVLNPIRILLVYEHHLLLNLPMALGFTKQRKTQRLAEIGYLLPEYCYATTESDTELGVLLSALTKKWYPFRMYIPYASAFGEFLSGYISREQWLEDLLKVNAYTSEDVEYAARHFRGLLANESLVDSLSVNVNSIFCDQYAGMDSQAFVDEVLIEISHNHKILLVEYLLKIGKHDSAAGYAQKAIDICPEDPVGYLYQSVALQRGNRLEEALAVCRKGHQKWPDHFMLGFQAAILHAGLKRPDLALEILKGQAWPEKAVGDANITAWAELRYQCHQDLKQGQEAEQWAHQVKLKQGALTER